MGNSYSSSKPSLPSLNLGKVKQLTPDNSDELYIGSGHPQHNVISLSSSRLPGTARKLQPPQQLSSQQMQEVATHRMDHQSNKIIANNILSKPQIPALNFSRRDGFVPTGGTDQSFTSRGPGSLPNVQQRGSMTSRPAPAQTAMQQYSNAADAIRTAPAVETGPITPAQALKRYGQYLTAYEQSEILQYTSVWFLGKADVQKIKGNPHLQKTNYGYDDERGDYIITPRDHIAFRYEVQSVLGKGSFGQVLKVLDYKTGQYKALKIIRNKKRFHHQAQVELKVLEHLREHDREAANHVIHMQEHFTFRSHLCITFELLSINLYEFIKQNNFAGLSLQLIKRFAAQMLSCLRFLRQHKLIHCDLKPENVLLVTPQRSGIKVIDFGSSCFMDERMYTYVQSRFYRSPEVILGLPYGCEIDMWSFGCILAELFMGYPLFPGEDETEQLLCIMEIMGLPPRHLVDAASRRKVFFDTNGAPAVVPNSRGKLHHPGTKSLWSVLRCAEPGFVDLLDKCLRWNPAERLTPEQALAHPWMHDHMVAAVTQARNRHSARSRQDQAQGSFSAKLQPTSVMAAAAAALGPGDAAAKAAAAKAIRIPVTARAGSGNSTTLCYADVSDTATAVPGQHNHSIGMPAATAAGATGMPWHMQAEADGHAAANHTPHGLHGAASDTSQSGIDSTPRQLSQAIATGGHLPAVLPAVMQGVVSAATPAVMHAGGFGRLGGSSTPRNMETETPGVSLASRLYGSSRVAATHQQQQRTAPSTGNSRADGAGILQSPARTLTSMPASQQHGPAAVMHMQQQQHQQWEQVHSGSMHRWGSHVGPEDNKQHLLLWQLQQQLAEQQQQGSEAGLGGQRLSGDHANSSSQPYEGQQDSAMTA
eukprot:GHRR01009592.1.p1 GENE.GHRR01009592.1~~GHRR01009592.1.p1  ORF type:complete len:875 (+),score=386.54 GHRR01009592.1:541-3165(+)